MKNKIAIIGAGGLIGSALIKTLTANKEKYEIIKIRGNDLYSSPEEISEKIKDTKIVINLAGHSIAGRWSKKKKDLILKSRIDTTDNLVKAMALLDNKPSLLINASGISIYKDGYLADEASTEYNNSFLSQVIQKWERSAEKVSDMGVNLAVIRMGVVLSKQGGAYPKLRNVIKYFCSGIIGSGEQGFSFIHIDDLINAFIFILRNNLSGTFNLCTPFSSTNKEFTVTVAKSLKRPVIFKIPVFVMKLFLLEGHMLLSEGQKAYPGVLIDKGFTFSYDDVYKCVSKLEE